MSNTKISALTADTAPTSDDLIPTVNDPAGTPANRKVTLGDAITKASGLTGAYVKASGGVLTAGAIAQADLPVMTGDTGSGGVKGAVPAPTTGDATNFLKGDGTWGAIPGGGDALTSNPLSQFAATTSAQLKSVLSDETGSGAAVFGTSPTITTPVINIKDTELSIQDDGDATKIIKFQASGITSGNTRTLTVPDADLTVVGVATAQTLTNKTLTTPTIGSFTNAQHSHASAGGGGTLTSASITDFDTQVHTSTLNQMTAPSADLSINSHKLTNVTDPTTAQDAATKAYVDAIANGIDWKASVRATTTANGTLASAYANGSVVDGVTLVTGNRILLKNQTTGSENGIYVVAASGAPTRATDADANVEVTPGMAVFVEEGTTNANTGWVMTNTGAVTVGTTALTFVQFTGLGEVTAGTGLSKSGNTISIDTSVTVDKTTAQTLTNKTLTSPAITTPTGIVKGDVGLGNVDNTSDATKNSASVTLTNKTLTTPTIGDFTNAAHNHTNAAGGGQITDAALSAAVGITKGGTGQTTANAGLNALLPSQTGNANKALITDGSNTSWGSAGITLGQVLASANNYSYLI